jgi:hypothetical protein
LQICNRKRARTAHQINQDDRNHPVEHEALSDLKLLIAQTKKQRKILATVYCHVSLIFYFTISYIILTKQAIKKRGKYNREL